MRKMWSGARGRLVPFWVALAGFIVVSWIVSGPVMAKKPVKPPPPPPAPAGPAYTLIDLGTLGGVWSEARRINEAGQVVGNSGDAEGVLRPFLITPEDTDEDGEPDLWFKDENLDGINDLMITLGHPVVEPSFAGFASDINDQGVVVGYAMLWTGPEHVSGRMHQWVWKDLDADGEADASEMIYLGAITSDAALPATAAVNNHGQIVAVTPDDDPQVWPVSYCLITPEDTDDDGEPDLWFKDENLDGVNDLEIDLGPGFVWRDINDAGVLVCDTHLLVPEDTDDDGRADRWWRDDNSDEVNDLLVELPGIEDRWAEALRLNESGQVVGCGTSTVKSGNMYMIHAIRWEADQTPTDLGSPGKKIPSRGVALNDFGDVVGHGEGEGDALLWKDGTRYDLADLLTNPSGIESIAVQDINDSGHIVGRTNRGAFIAIPTPTDD